ncbi:hypothetical protein LIER_11752 [Lithospermum erythrorhizon]|uniref:Pentatricopeptide repeat-containing protein n=1 Tax=Lithospermum erythrorhizon TaxID=34254 RepID=A0AAV3PR20_LITER
MSQYGSFGHVKYARKLFDELPEPDFYSCKVMIRWYFLNDCHKEVVGFFGSMRRFVFDVVDNVVFSIVLKACTELRDLDEGRKLHCVVVKVGGADSFVLTGLVDMYAKSGEIEVSREIFEDIEDRNVVCWTSMIVGYVKNGCAEEGLVLFNRMRDGLVEGNEYTLGSIVTACTKLGYLHQGMWVHGYAIKKGITPNGHLISSLVDMYVKCGVIRDARLLFDEFYIMDLVTWTSMIVGYTQAGYPKEALKLFIDKRWQAVYPNCVTLSSVLSSCAKLFNLKLGSSIHSLGIKLGLDDLIVSNALLDMYGKCGRITDAYYMFETLIHKDVTSWNSIISVYSSNGWSFEALKLFRKMRLDNVQPDGVTMVAVLSASTSLGAFEVGLSAHAYSMKKGHYLSNVYVGTALLNLYAKYGDVKASRVVFDEMKEKSKATWSALIGGYGMLGDTNNSLDLLQNMVKQRLEPNDIIFTSLLSACSHTGLIREGWELFNTMCHQYGIVPSMKHYVCMVDLMARAGRLEEAWALINDMPVQPDITLFVAFLHGCSIHCRYDLANVAIWKMREKYVHDSCHYVLLSNLYASEQRWSQAYQMRELMERNGLTKYPGGSQLEFSSSDLFYSQGLVSTA